MKVRRCLLSLLFGFCLLPVSAQTASVPIASVSFEGNKSIDAQQLKRLFRASLVGNRYVAEFLAADLQLVEKAYQDEGFLEAKIGPPNVQIQMLGKGKAAAIRIPVVEGFRYTLRGAAVRNVQALASSALMQMCPLQKGQPYSRAKISQWQAKIEEAYRAIGHIRARCSAQEILHEDDKTVDCTLVCIEGKPYSVRKITLIADKSIDPLQFKRRLLLSEGGIFNPEFLSLSIHFLNQMHLYKPISDSDVKIGLDDANGTVDLDWHIFLPER